MSTCWCSTSPSPTPSSPSSRCHWRRAGGSPCRYPLALEQIYVIASSNIIIDNITFILFIFTKIITLFRETWLSIQKGFFIAQRVLNKQIKIQINGFRLMLKRREMYSFPVYLKKYSLHFCFVVLIQKIF